VDARVTIFARLIGVDRAPLIQGQIYTIRDIDIWDGVISVRLVEIIEPVLDIWINRPPTEATWSPRRFRPVVERTTDISIFTEMLTPTSKESTPAL